MGTGMCGGGAQPVVTTMHIRITCLWSINDYVTACVSWLCVVKLI